MGQGNTSKNAYEVKIQELSELMLEKDSHYDDLRRKYEQSIFNLKDTLTKNEILTR